MPGIDDSKPFLAVRIAVLTVSDSRSLDDDRSGAVLVERVEAAGHEVADRRIVTDDVASIVETLRSWIDDSQASMS